MAAHNCNGQPSKPIFMYNTQTGLLGCVTTYIFGLVSVDIIPDAIPDAVTWTLQNLAFIATIIAAVYTIYSGRKKRRQRNEKQD